MIGVVGGGVAGLAAAHRLQATGHDVTVFEASDALGGLAATYETAGDPIERYYHHLSKSEETIVELAADLGLGDEIEWRIGKNAYYADGTVHPMDTPWQLLAFPYWSLYDTFRLGTLTLGIDVRSGIPRKDTYESLEDFEDVPVKDFVVEHTTETVYETFFEPLLEAKFGERAEDVSAAWLLGRVKFRGERDLLRGEILGYLDGGFGRLLDALVADVGEGNVVTGARVTAIGVENGAVETLSVERPVASEVASADGSGRADAGPATRAGDRGGNGNDPGAGQDAGDIVTETLDVDAVVVATMPNVLEVLTGYSCDIEFQGTVCSVIAMDEPLTETYWLNVADEAPFGALIEHTNFVPAERYGGEHLLYAVKYVQGTDDPLWQQDDGAVEETWLAGIEDLFPDFDRETVTWIETSRNPRTAPVYERGYLDMVIPYDLGEDVAEGLYYAGMASRAQYPERSLNGGVEAGYACADSIDERLG